MTLLILGLHVVGILDESGSLVVEYKDDACGKLPGTTGRLAGTTGEVNPMRYGGTYMMKGRGCIVSAAEGGTEAMKKEVLAASGFRCVRAVPITAGMSSDEKYDVELDDGRRCLLRISQKSQLERKKKEYEMTLTAFRHGIYVPQPYAFGRYDENRIYQLTEWIDGQTLESEMTSFSEKERHYWGERAGELLRQIHSIPVPPAEEWNVRFRRKIEIRAEEAREELSGFDGFGRMYRKMTEKIDVLDHCQQCFSHGDFYPGNLIHGPDGRLAAIDFNAYNGGCGDPVFETASILMDRKTDEQFKRGFESGYYGGRPNRETEAVLEYYRSYMLLAEFCETEDEAERADILERMRSLAGEV